MADQKLLHQKLLHFSEMSCPPKIVTYFHKKIWMWTRADHFIIWKARRSLAFQIWPCPPASAEYKFYSVNYSLVWVESWVLLNFFFILKISKYFFSVFFFSSGLSRLFRAKVLQEELWNWSYFFVESTFLIRIRILSL